MMKIKMKSATALLLTLGLSATASASDPRLLGSWEGDCVQLETRSSGNRVIESSSKLIVIQMLENGRGVETETTFSSSDCTGPAQNEKKIPFTVHLEKPEKFGFEPEENVLYTRFDYRHPKHEVRSATFEWFFEAENTEAYFTILAAKVKDGNEIVEIPEEVLDEAESVYLIKTSSKP